MQFNTDFVYTSRETKARYVWEKYALILRGSILDVGADKQHLKQYLDAATSYWGVGLGGNTDQQVDLEAGPLPFADDSYDVVLCLDVLEHIETIHSTFDELCRVARHYVIVSLPNPVGSFYSALKRGVDYDLVMKYYGLPVEPPEDRHKWFFSYDEALRFIEYRAEKNNMSIVQIDPVYKRRSLTQAIRRSIRWLGFKQQHVANFHKGTIWAVLQK